MSGTVEEDDDGQGDLLDVLPAGTTLPGYELKSLLGHGAFGITYLARGLTLDRDVAIKEYLPTNLAVRRGRTTVRPRSAAHAEQFAWGRERFLDEARTLARLDRTPAIVRVYDFLEANGTAYMVMALIEGENLNRRLMREVRLTPESVEHLLFPLLDGLEEVHAIGFLHRDIKPANIMVDARGRPTLIDFGAARAAMAGRSTTMTAIFTPGYAAAEQYASAELGPWTDIYGLSATLYHAITGKIPPSSIDRILNDTYEPLSELKPEGYPPELLAGIDAGMERHVGERPQSIVQWRHVLRTGERQASAQEATQVERKPRRLFLAASRNRKAGIALRGPALWGAAAAAAVLLAGGGYLAFTASQPATTIATASLNLTTEQLEQVLAERRKADTFAAEKRKLEEEARQKAEADGEAKRQADAELEQARQARQKAEEELAELKARIEAQRQGDSGQRDQAAAAAQREAEEAAQRKAEADAAALRQAEEDARKKVEADAEAKRQADEALAKAEAERQSAEQAARAKAEAEQAALRQSSQEAQRKAVEAESVRQAEAERTKAEAARQKAEAERQKAEAEAKVRAEAETAEKALRLDQQGRERVQLALTSLGFDTRGTDGIFGPRSREMLSAWQKARNQQVTGFLNTAQQEALLKEAAPALSKHDEQKKAEEEAKARLAAAAPALGPIGAPTEPSDGLWRGTFECNSGNDDRAAPFKLNLEARLSNGVGAWYAASNSPSTGYTGSVRISVDGANVTAVRGSIGGRTYASSAPLTGQFEGNSIRASNSFCTMVLTRDGSPGVAATTSTPARPGSVSLPDGTYSGAFQQRNGPLNYLSVQLKNGSGTGSVMRAGCGSAPISVRVDPSGNVVGDATLFNPSCSTMTKQWSGRVDGSRLVLTIPDQGEFARQEVALSIGAGVPGDSAAAAPGAVQSSPTSTSQPSNTAFDGTYGGGTVPGGSVGGTPRLAASLQVSNGRGSGTLTRPDCSPSQFSVTISPTGNVSGEGYLNCAIGASGVGTYSAGPLKIYGSVKDRSLHLEFRTDQREFAVVLRPGGAMPKAPPSPDGLWRGTYSCDAGPSPGVTDKEFRINLELRLSNGSGSWRSASPTMDNGFSFEVSVAVQAKCRQRRALVSPIKSSDRGWRSGLDYGEI